MYWVGWVISVLAALILIASGIAKVAMPVNDEMQKNLNDIGWSVSKLPTLAILESLSAIIYLIPRTAVIGAILATGYMGGAIATHYRVNDPPIAQVIIPILFWLGLWLRDGKLRELIPIRR